MRRENLETEDAAFERLLRANWQRALAAARAAGQPRLTTLLPRPSSLDHEKLRKWAAAAEKKAQPAKPKAQQQQQARE